MGSTILTGGVCEDVDAIPMSAYHGCHTERHGQLPMPTCSKIDSNVAAPSAPGRLWIGIFCCRLDAGLRGWRSEALAEEIYWPQEKHGITFIARPVDTLMSFVSISVRPFEDIIEADVQIERYHGVYVVFAEWKMLRLLGEALSGSPRWGFAAGGKSFVKCMDIFLTAKQSEEGFTAKMGRGISPGFKVIFGNSGENCAAPMTGVQCLAKHDGGSQRPAIRSATLRSGRPLGDHAMNERSAEGIDDGHESRHLSSDVLASKFESLSDEGFNLALMEADSALRESYQAARSSAVAGARPRTLHESGCSIAAIQSGIEKRYAV